jgi:hypothetical protein
VDDNSICRAALRRQGSTHRCECIGQLACRYGHHTCRECVLHWSNDGWLSIDVMVRDDMVTCNLGFEGLGVDHVHLGRTP